nr:coiled-coil domain-containing protein 130 [Cryptococcus depauperatus CBS 7855]
MQGFNRYVPPDFDPKKTSTLNAYQGKKHALGVRAKDIDKGILIVRFELPFNIWCGTCNAHIGAGVRYNAQKRKVGNYYSTPIYAFRCKCHLCSGWFEIRTDPKNATYVVEEGAKKKDEDWNPEEHGGFKIFGKFIDTEAPSASEAPVDPIAHLEKTIDQQEWAKKGTSRITELSRASTRLSSDPYAVSVALRKKFREEKKVLLEKQARDDDIRDRYGLAEDVDLGDEDVEGRNEQWKAGRAEKGLNTSANQMSSLGGFGHLVNRGNRSEKGRTNDTLILAAELRKTTAKKYSPFSTPSNIFAPVSPSVTSNRIEQLSKGRIKNLVCPVKTKKTMEGHSAIANSNIGTLEGGLLSGYESE